MTGVLRFLLPLAVLALLALTGVVDLSVLPWRSGEFQTSLAVVLVYLVHSAAGPREDGARRIGLYAVLLMSVLDAFLLRLTVFRGLFALRWCGVFLLAAGSVLCHTGSTDSRRFRAGRVLQLLGLPLGLASMAGLATAVLPAAALIVKRDPVP